VESLIIAIKIRTNFLLSKQKVKIHHLGAST